MVTSASAPGIAPTKTPYRDGTAHVLLEPLDLLARLKVIASIEDPALIERILAHLEQQPETEQPRSPFASRAPPSQLF